MKVWYVVILIVIGCDTDITNVLGQICSGAPRVNYSGGRTSPMPYIYNVINIVNSWLGLKLDPSAVTSSFFDGAYNLMESGNNTGTNISSGCISNILDLVMPFDHFAKKPRPLLDEALMHVQWRWFGKMMDSWGRPPAGIFEGNRKWLGSYQQCNRVPIARYCLVSTVFAEAPLTFGKIIHLGTCLPKQCTHDDVRVMLDYVEKMVHRKIVFTNHVCDKPHNEYNSNTIKALMVLGSLILLSIVGAIVESYDVREDAVKEQIPNGDVSQSENDTDVNGNIANEAASTSTASASTTTMNVVSNEKHSLIGKCLLKVKDMAKQFVRCFSLVRNLKNCMSTKMTDAAIGNINGVRFFTTCIITTGHAYIYIFEDDKFRFSKTMTRIWFMPIANSPAFVDLFFLMSGFLASYLTLRWIARGNTLNIKSIIILYLHRYIRLAPTLGVIILINTYVVPLIRWGPMAMYEDKFGNEVEECENYWWTNMLYMNNFHPAQESNCVSWTWYLPNDWQMFCACPFILLLVLYATSKTQRKMLVPGLIFIIMLTASIVTRFYLFYKHNLAGVSMFSNSIAQRKELDYNGYWDKLYVKPYARCGPYIVGIFLGYLIAKTNRIAKDHKWRWTIGSVGWSVFIVLAWYSIFSPFKAFSRREYSKYEHWQYGTFYNSAIALAFAWLIYACHNNMGGVLNTFLSWRGWIPLSRVSYGSYLVHPIICKFFLTVQEHHITLQENMFWIVLPGIISLSFFYGAVLFVFVEGPAVQIENKLFTR